MKMTLGQILGGVMARLGEGSAVGEVMLIEQINLAGDDIMIAMRAAWSEKALTTSYVNLIQDQDLYEFPPDVDEVRKMDRLDLGSTAYPVNRREMMRDDIGGSRSLSGAIIDSSTPYTFQEGLSYILETDNRFRLIEVPTTSTTNGLRIKHYPRFVPLTSLDQVPNLPERIHEALIAKTLERAMGLEGIQLVNPRAAAMFIARWEKNLTEFLYPPDAERGPEVDEEYGYYEERF